MEKLSPWFRVFLAALVILGVGVVAFSLSSCSSSEAQVTNDTVNYTPPTTREDGSALPDSEILQYTIKWGAVPGGPYTAGNAVVQKTERPWIRTNRPAGRACYVMRTIDTAGIESVDSNESCTEKCPLGQRVNTAGSCVTIPPPNAPGNVSAS